MTIPDHLKENLIADVENTLGLNLPPDIKTTLSRAFEITVGAYVLPKEKALQNNTLEQRANLNLLNTYWVDKGGRLHHMREADYDFTKCMMSTRAMRHTNKASEGYSFCNECLEEVHQPTR